VPNWKILVQDRRWKELVEKAKTLHKELYSHNKKRRYINIKHINMKRKYLLN
jgi:hypothetical protein